MRLMEVNPQTFFLYRNTFFVWYPDSRSFQFYWNNKVNILVLPILRLKSTKYSKFCLYTSFQDDLNLLENGGIPPVFEGRMGLPPPPPLMPFGPYPMLPLKRSPQWTVDRNMKLLAYISIVVLAFLLLIIVIIVLIVFFQHYGM